MNRTTHSSIGLGATLLFSMILCILCAGPMMRPVHATANSGPEVQTQHNASHKIQRIIVAGSPAVCKANYDQCMRGCAGAQSCSNQCMTNYNGCLH